MEKYITVKVAGIITRIAETTETEGYTKGIIESFLPDASETDNWDKGKTDAWIVANNKRMTAICEFLNQNNL